jgi:hypothetical protein
VPAGPVAELRDRLLAAAAGPYTGYAESTGRLGLPALPQLESAVSLVTSTTRLRAFVASPQRYRVDELTPVGERGLYRRDGLEAAWDFGFDQFTALPADPPLRLPRAADLLPPALAARLLRLAPDARLEPLPARRSPAGTPPVCGWCPPTRRPPSGAWTCGPTWRPGCRSPWRWRPARTRRPRC